MITLMRTGPRYPERPTRLEGPAVVDAAWTALSIASAIILLPAIAVDEAIRAFFPRKADEVRLEYYE
ncbi:hypothetical protein [Paenarthrobacter nitroguajacolicus]|uniref:hypothetical protein n=1 Tax=Paenarthrobacter nitroguajacolicus TaxID=211146 RepID=UPI00111260BC|nr:hypothetical protein [Paenarthrobacter nitroguajacolicus]